MRNSKDLILKNIKNSLGEIKTDFEYADSLFKDDNLVSDYGSNI